MCRDAALGHKAVIKYRFYTVASIGRRGRQAARKKLMDDTVWCGRSPGNTGYTEMCSSQVGSRSVALARVAAAGRGVQGNQWHTGEVT